MLAIGVVFLLLAIKVTMGRFQRPPISIHLDFDGLLDAPVYWSEPMHTMPPVPTLDVTGDVFIYTREDARGL